MTHITRRYHYAKLSSLDFGFLRSPGPGLGNLLFPICRALLGSNLDKDGAFVYPTLPQLKIGPWVRGEHDKRTYGGVLKHRRIEDWNTFLRAKLAKDAVDEESNDYSSSYANKIVYSGLRNHFYDLEGNESLIHSWLLKSMIQYPKILRPSKIVIHVRQGDFSEYNPDLVDACYRTPHRWFKNALRYALLSDKATPRVLLLTDGDHREVSKSIGLSDYDLPPKNLNALQTMFLGSNCETLIASKSTFSMWMRFLGTSRVLWEPQFDLSKYFSATGRDIFIQ